VELSKRDFKGTKNRFSESRRLGKGLKAAKELAPGVRD